MTSVFRGVVMHQLSHFSESTTVRQITDGQTRIDYSKYMLSVMFAEGAVAGVDFFVVVSDGSCANTGAGVTP